MIKEAIGVGATVEEAFENAKNALAAPEDMEIQQEILELPKKKTLGLFGGSPAKVRAFYEIEESPFQFAETYLRGILAGMGVEDAKIEFSVEDDTVMVQLDCGGHQGTVIGRRGETLDAIQYLVRLVLNKNKDKDGYKRVSINVGSYREKREETLRELAKKSAARVRKNGRNVVLDPMNPYERRVVHTAIQEIEGVDSHSVGSDSERRVVITLAEGFTAENPSEGRRDNYRGGNRGGRGGRGGYRGGNRGGKGRGSDKGSTAPTRPPRSDNTSASLYGKIEPKAKEEPQAAEE